MKKLILIILLSYLVSPKIIAQESIGFSNPDNIQPLLDYRLPAWGYHSLIWDFSLDGSLNSRDSEFHGSTSSDDHISGRLSPVYLQFRESESRFSTFTVRPEIDYSYRDRKFFGSNDEYNSRLGLGLNWGLDEKWYRDQSDLFFQGSASGDFRNVRLRNEKSMQGNISSDLVHLFRNFNTVLSTGIGYGRLRNVNPMIRSLRLSERLNALDTGQSLNENDVFLASEQFTRSNGYQQIYDRPLKHFWGDMDNLLSADLSALDAFDLFYLTDTVSEALGSRREGWQVSANAGIQYLITYSRDDNEITGQSDSYLNRHIIFIPSVSGAWSKNLSLKHQLGFGAFFQYSTQLNGSSLSDLSTLNVNYNWLYTITDRILMDTFLNYTRIRRDFNIEYLNFGTNINYFIENRFSIFASAAFTYIPGSATITTGDGQFSETTSDLRFSAGLRYHMRRGMF